MTFRTLLGSTRKPNSSFCLVCWPDEENKLSIVPSKKIASPRPGKENKTPSRQKKGAKKKGSIILVGAHMAKDVKNFSPVQAENSSAQSPKPRTRTENATTPASPTHSLGDHTDSSTQPQTAAAFNPSLDDSISSIASLLPPLSSQTSLSPYENVSVHQSGTIDPGKSTYVQ